MSNFVYTKAIDRIGTDDLGGIDLVLDTIVVQGVATGSGNYIASQSADDTLVDIPAWSRIGPPTELTNRSFVNGVFDADDITIVNSDPSTIDALVFYKLDAGSPTDESLCYLLGYIDTASNMPYDTGGLDVPIVWSNSANKILKIG